MQVQKSHVCATKLLTVYNSPLPQTIPIAPLNFLYVVTVCWTFWYPYLHVRQRPRCSYITCSVLLMRSTAQRACIDNGKWGRSHTTFSPPPSLVFVTVNFLASYLPMPSTMNITVGQCQFLLCVVSTMDNLHAVGVVQWTMHIYTTICFGPLLS